MAYIPQKDTTTDMRYSKFKNRFRHAFTMLELVFVIIIIGILASTVISHNTRDLSQEAADSILSDIRYTQHLALTDNKHVFNDARWERAYWRIVFSTCTGTDRFYMIGSDRDFTGSNNAFFDRNESAMDPNNNQPMFWVNGNDCSDGDPARAVSKRIFITKNYGVTNVASAGGCAAAAHIAFDYLGRPYNGVNFSNSNQPNHEGYMAQDCTFTFTMSDASTFAIQINRETGYAFIVGQPDS